MLDDSLQSPHDDAQALLAAGRAAAAETLLHKQVAADPGDYLAWVLIARCRLASEHYEDALAAIDRAFECGGASTQAHVLRGQTLLDLAAGDTAAERGERLTAARIEFETALDLSPGDLDALKGVARAHLLRGDFRALSLAAEEALAVDPQDVDAAHWRVIALMSLARPGDAAVVLDGLTPEVAAHPRMDNLRTWVDAHRGRWGAWCSTLPLWFWLLSLAAPVVVLTLLERIKDLTGPAQAWQLELRAGLIAACLAALSCGATLLGRESWHRKLALRQAQPFSSRGFRQAERRQRQFLASAATYASLIGVAMLVGSQGLWLTGFALGLTGVALVQAWSIPPGIWAYAARGVALAATALASVVVAVIPSDAPHHGAACIMLLMALAALVLALKRPGRARVALVFLALAAVTLDIAAVMEAAEGNFVETADAFYGTLMVFVLIALIDASARFREAVDRPRATLDDEWRPPTPLPAA